MGVVDVNFIGVDHLFSCTNVRKKIGALPRCASGQYSRDDVVVKSSVGEFYDENMKFFIKTAEELMVPMADYLSDRDASDVEVSRFCANMKLRLTPLGAIAGSSWDSGNTITENSLRNYIDNDIDWLYESALQPIVGLRVLGGTPVIIKDTYRHRYEEGFQTVESSAHALCAGYAPREDMPVIQELIPDTENMRWTILANILYPWVMQPMSQLRMLVSQIPAGSVEKIIGGAVKMYLNSPHGVGSQFDYGYGFTFDAQSDFLTYLNVRNSSVPFLQRQIWTPWMGFDIPSELTGWDSKYLDVMNDMITRSDRLYMEMLKTGLRYESQYSVLMGFRGRYCFAGNVGAMASLSNKLFADGDELPRSTNPQLATYIKEQVLARVPFVQNLFDSVYACDVLRGGDDVV